MSEDQAFWDGFSRKREDEWTQALSRLLQFDTVSGDPAPEAVKAWRAKISEGFAYLKQLAEGLGFVTRQYEDRVLVIEQAGPEGAPVLGLPIHLDVVPAGEGWVHEPFGGEIADGAVWGRGSQDDKGPIIEAIYALAGASEWAAVAGRSFS
ncbi:M20/M25/M40 family metallo-hydrolase [Candidatus Sumerlaeota bacterium]|nr:M20/M25/M40 family metallo-hydrolase [Candidatus Sumerlaeota bacterium]